ncbi:hypothetical protein C8F01DRAFT_1075627 [Mycena amicta]|nr:hypothetical protein C8F01DRAFT_1075627 [Mycena amicta]
MQGDVRGLSVFFCRRKGNRCNAFLVPWFLRVETEKMIGAKMISGRLFAMFCRLTIREIGPGRQSSESSLKQSQRGCSSYRCINKDGNARSQADSEYSTYLSVQILGLKFRNVTSVLTPPACNALLPTWLAMEYVQDWVERWLTVYAVESEISGQGLRASGERRTCLSPLMSLASDPLNEHFLPGGQYHLQPVLRRRDGASGQPTQTSVTARGKKRRPSNDPCPSFQFANDNLKLGSAQVAGG